MKKRIDWKKEAEIALSKVTRLNQLADNLSSELASAKMRADLNAKASLVYERKYNEERKRVVSELQEAAAQKLRADDLQECYNTIKAELEEATAQKNIMAESANEQPPWFSRDYPLMAALAVVLCGVAMGGVLVFWQVARDANRMLKDSDVIVNGTWDRVLDDNRKWCNLAVQRQTYMVVAKAEKEIISHAKDALNNDDLTPNQQRKAALAELEKAP